MWVIQKNLYTENPVGNIIEKSYNIIPSPTVGGTFVVLLVVGFVFFYHKKKGKKSTWAQVSGSGGAPASTADGGGGDREGMVSGEDGAGGESMCRQRGSTGRMKWPQGVG